MQVIQQPFRISTGLKDLIGRDLITEDFVAVFELVKNSFDAHAKTVRVLFEEDRIVIADNGKGMSRDDILKKWLFIAYSAKREGTEDDNYKVSGPRRPFAGAKGVGRFSCDRLGKQLSLFSKAKGHPIQKLEADWTQYENDAHREFGDVKVQISEASNFPSCLSKPRGETGTILEIRGLRSEWDRDKLQRLKRELMKLINPFSGKSPELQIEIIAPDQKPNDKRDADYNATLSESDGKDPRLTVNGKVENSVLQVLSQRTTVIRVAIINAGETIESILEDRGEKIYRIKETNPYLALKDTDLVADIYFLNRSAKVAFARRMGLPSVQFGSIFLFRNGFRVMPLGAEDDDFFGLNRRKQQGVRRFLGGRDLIGRVDIKGVEGFEEATSRNQGLIRTPAVTELIDCVRDKCVRRLERYVVDITWKDQYDKDTVDMSRMKLDESSALVAQLVSRLAATEGVELVEYNPELVRIVDEKSAAFESSLKALELLADGTGDKALLSRVDEAKARMKALQASETAAREAERRAEIRAVEAERTAAAAEVKYGEERKRNQFLVAAASLDQDTVLNLHHQIIMHASDVHLGVKRMMGKLRKGISICKEDWIDFLERVSFRNSQILTASRFATKGGYKQQSAEINADLSVYIRDYVTTVSSLWAPRGVEVDVQSDGEQLERKFRPIEVGILIDNLVSNAVKARAKKVKFFLEVAKGAKPELTITVVDDGIGWPQSMNPIERVFEKGVTTTDGSGLGLYHVKQVVEGLGGFVEARQEPYSEELGGAQFTLRVPS